MANSYSPAAGYTTVPCDKEQYEKLNGLLGSIFNEENRWHGFQFWLLDSDNECHLVAEDGCNPDDLPQKFLEGLGELLKQNNMPYLKVGVAMYCDKMRPGEFGGYDFKIGQDGSIVYPKVVWPEGYED